MSALPRRLAVLAVLALVVVAAGVAIRSAHDDSRRHYLATGGWPVHGQAAYALGARVTEASPDQRAAPIASLAKVMTAYLVLQAAPLIGDGFRLTVTSRDVADTATRQSRDESIVRVERGEVLTERQALAAVLLPSANNVAIMLARRIAGTVDAFVQKMNRTARQLGMYATTYTDPSGYDEGTRSTAADQLVLAQVAMRNKVFAELVGAPRYDLPVVGTVHNTDTLLGKHGFVGIKTGSDDAAGGCFMFRTRRTLNGAQIVLTGVVLGQPGRNLIMTGQYAAQQLADRVAPPV
jgi:serine-type D-Ala-D-Ala carboxypeptidase (penicillin-binding protein 5/6)